MAAEVVKWHNAKYPYDNASCGNCLGQHYSWCKDPKHQPMVDVVTQERKLLSATGLGDKPKEARDLFLKLRKKFARFYPASKGTKWQERPAATETKRWFCQRCQREHSIAMPISGCEPEASVHET